MQVSHLGRVWRYSVSWYRDPALLGSLIIVKSRPRDVTRRLDISAWTNQRHVAARAHSLPLALYVQVSVDELMLIKGQDGSYLCLEYYPRESVLVTSDVLQVSVAGQGVAGARVTASLTHVDNNGGHHTLEPAVTLSDDGAAGDDL